MSRLPPGATCTFALRMLDGRYVSDPAREQGSYSLDSAHLWLWPAEESVEARDARIAAVREQHPWIGPVAAVRSRT